MAISFWPLLAYGVRSVLISAVFTCYYQLFLRNAAFHVYNRLYLLVGLPSALILPLVRFPFRLPWAVSSDSETLVRIVLGEGRTTVSDMAAADSSGDLLNAVSQGRLLMGALYGLVAMLLFIRVAVSIS